MKKPKSKPPDKKRKLKPEDGTYEEDLEEEEEELDALDGVRAAFSALVRGSFLYLPFIRMKVPVKVQIRDPSYFHALVHEIAVVLSDFLFAGQARVEIRDLPTGKAFCIDLPNVAGILIEFV